MSLLKLFYCGWDTVYITHAKFILSGLVVSFKALPVGSNIIVENGWLNRILVLSGDNSFLGGIHAADGRAIVASAAFITGTDTLNPGDLNWMLAI
jgi:hypothetical protein